VGTLRQPVVYVPHGGGPWPFVDVGIGSAAELAALAGFLRGLRDLAPQPPTAILCVSAHWEEPVPTVSTAQQPPMLYDYVGFPPASYAIQWPAPGSPNLAARVQRLLSTAGIANAADGRRGYDHGCFVPLKLAFPDANVPCVQLSLVRGLAPALHLAVGRALAPLRDDGVLIVGSGMSYHNLRAFGPGARPVATTFDRWLQDTCTRPAAARDHALIHWTNAPAARAAHPREEHLLPLHVVAGAAGDDVGVVAFAGTLVGLDVTGFAFG
jgi:aromatic ring-opening dioxygenase catalytic subunit (LigB family)